MKSKGLLTATIFLLVLSGVIWWSNKKAARADKTRVETATVKLLNLPEDQIQDIEIKKLTGETIQLKRNDSKWLIAGAEPLRADPDAVSSMLSTISSLSSDRTVEEKASSLEPYGLAPATIELNVTDKNKKTAKVLIGDDTPAGTAVYAAVAGDARVFALASYKKNSFDKSTKDLRQNGVLPFDADKVSTIELTAKRQIIAFGRSKDEWELVKPKPFRADRSQVEELLRALHDAKMDLRGSEDEKKAAAAFGTGTPFATVRVTDVSGTLELQVRKNKDDYYAKSSAVVGVYKISSGTGTGTGLDKGLEDFRNKKLFDFGFAEPEKIEIHDGCKSYFLTRRGSDSWLNGTKMDAGTGAALVDKVRDLLASKFMETGFAASVLDVTVTSDGGKRVAKEMISKNGDNYLAKRENEPALYGLNPSAITEMQKTAAALKPAPPPTKK